MIKRKSSKAPNVYKLVISDRDSIYDYSYFCSIGKALQYLEVWSENTIDEAYEIVMTKKGLCDEKILNNWGTLIDKGSIDIIESKISYDVKLYKINIKN